MNDARDRTDEELARAATRSALKEPLTAISADVASTSFW